ncbi:MAG: hypothetical protein NZ483_11620, partial [Verrucomicrobiae bacterium]|nr:hypothetical protein [Verrucomicrobiae bacterium]
TGTWDPRTGAYEHPALGRGAACYRLSERLRDASHVSRWVMWRRKWLRAKAKIHLRRALHEAEYLKTGDARVPMLARQLGFTPCILLLFRNYREQFASAYLRHGSSVRELRQYYLDVNQSALLALSIYGGTVIHYADMVDCTKSEWARAVSEVTGLPADRLLEKRAELVKPQAPRGTSSLIEDRDLDALDIHLRSLCGQIFVASRLAERT